MTDEQFKLLYQEIRSIRWLVVILLAAILGATIASGCSKAPSKDEVPDDVEIVFMGDSLDFNPEYQVCLSPEESRQRERFCFDEWWEDLSFLRDSICESWGLPLR